MNCTTLLIRVITSTLLIFLISSCDRESTQHSHDEIAELKAEFEQLGNQVGRLEFRIFELEAQLSSETPARETTIETGITNSSNHRDTPVQTDDGNYDLTPVE